MDIRMNRRISRSDLELADMSSADTDLSTYALCRESEYVSVKPVKV
jgi:hypothetical protein